MHKSTLLCRKGRKAGDRTKDTVGESLCPRIARKIYFNIFIISFPSRLAFQKFLAVMLH